MQATLSLCSFSDIFVETVHVGTIIAGSDAGFGDVGTCHRSGAFAKAKGPAIGYQSLISIYLG